VVLTLEWRRRPLAASESERSATAVATPRRRAYQPFHFGSDSSSLKAWSALVCSDSCCLQLAQRNNAGFTTLSTRLSRSRGFPDGPRRIGPELGLPSALRSSARMPFRGSITGTGLTLLAVFGEVVQTRQTLRRTKIRLPSKSSQQAPRASPGRRPAKNISATAARAFCCPA